MIPVYRAPLFRSRANENYRVNTVITVFWAITVFQGPFTGTESACTVNLREHGTIRMSTVIGLIRERKTNCTVDSSVLNHILLRLTKESQI